MNKTLLRYPLLFLAGFSLLVALIGGLVRLGWWPGVFSGRTAGLHSALMMAGFLGTLIALERAVALKRPLAYFAPLLSGSGALALWGGAPDSLGRGLIVLASLVFGGVFGSMLRRHTSIHGAVMGVGSLLWFAGNLLWWFGWPLYYVVPWWAGFLILTIAGERLELARVLRWPRQVQALFLGIVALFLAGLCLSTLAYDLGVRLAGVGLMALSLWLGRYDVARRTVRQTGLTRFIAACLLSGYVWLFLGGATWLVYGGTTTAGPVYSTLLHSLFLGFVFSMIFGHAPIIIPAVIGKALPYRSLFYGHLTLLHLSLAVRLLSNLVAWVPGRQWGGLLNGLSILWFLFVTIGTIRLSKPHQMPSLTGREMLID